MHENRHFFSGAVLDGLLIEGDDRLHRGINRDAGMTYTTVVTGEDAVVAECSTRLNGQSTGRRCESTALAL